MAKIIKYKILANEKRQLYTTVKANWSEVNEEIAKKAAFNGEYEIVDDGKPEIKSDKERLEELEEAFALLLEGATE